MLWKLPNIVIAPERLFDLFGNPDLPVSNTLLATWISIIFLVVLFFFGTRRRDMIPSGLQNFLEYLLDFLLGQVEGVAGKEKGRKFFPLVATFFIFILACNMLDVIPGVDTIGTIHAVDHAVHPVFGIFLLGDDSNQLIPWLRPATTDLNLTIAMAVVSVVTTQIFGFQALGAGEQLSKYFNFKSVAKNGAMGLIDLVVGLLEIISELGRIISFSFRLFGNIFAGSVLLAVFAFLLPGLATIIFIPFEIFVGVIQAYVFSFLTLLFMTVGTTSHSHDDSEHDAHEAYAENRAADAVVAH
ncbi:F0F1 ATP synthase subunit A [Tengunoibacter tsumagoiensis]|uniref:ATP synthase subunit a n=1 Tax=Tengunoibacter tsumagoiensis TaxID=2014871 RepID=A0A402A588_9CHLR|nr:F0F1 ATP synthase subunit A [Tengunoibacter tsumagoiensis]GCE14308.1 ATP synthase subunit a [Tengunoibacter tsumagoiensis]